MKKIIVRDYKKIIIPILLVLINAGLIFSMKDSIGSRVLFILPLLVIQLVVSFLALFFWEKKGWKFHQLFLLVAIVTGLAYTFIMPLGSVPDERNHFRRAYEISGLHFTSEIDPATGIGGRILPSSIDAAFGSPDEEAKGYPYSDFVENFSPSVQDDTREWQNFGNTSLYSPFVYIPQAIGIDIGRILHLPMFAIVYLARIFNLIFWIILGYYIIRFIPFGKGIAFLLLFMPTSMQAAASCQADAVANVTAVALFTYVLYKIKTPRAISKKDYVLSSALAILVSMSKIVYLPLCFLLYLLPAKMFKSKKHKFVSISLVIAAAVLLNFIWLLISSRYLSAEFQAGVNTSEQVGFIISHPLGFLQAIFRTIIGNGNFYFFTFFGSSLSWLNINLAEPYILAFAFYAFYTYLRESQKNFSLDNQQKFYIFLSVSVCVLLIFASLYIQWTSVAAPVVAGIQGRYFIPVALPLMFLLPTLSKDNKDKSNSFEPQIISVSLALTVYALAAYMCHFLA